MDNKFKFKDHFLTSISEEINNKTAKEKKNIITLMELYLIFTFLLSFYLCVVGTRVVFFTCKDPLFYAFIIYAILTLGYFIYYPIALSKYHVFSIKQIIISLLLSLIIIGSFAIMTYYMTDIIVESDGGYRSSLSFSPTIICIVLFLIYSCVFVRLYRKIYPTNKE